MKILGICHDVYVCSAAVVIDGEVRSAISEERLDRVKKSRTFPVRAIARCMSEASVDVGDLDEIAVAWNPSLELQTTPTGYLKGRRWRGEHLSQVPAQLLSLFGEAAGELTTQTVIGAGCPPITYVDHYQAHIGEALLTSPFERCAVVVLDGRGERLCGLLGEAEDVAVEVLETVLYPHSIGLFYGAFTEFLGFCPDADEWKVMALGAYANSGEDYLDRMRTMLTVHSSGRYTLDLSYFEFYNAVQPKMYSDKLTAVFGPARLPDEPIEDRHREIAAALQRVFEESVSEILTRLQGRTGHENIVLSGGCFMNSAYNGKITSTTPFRRAYISSCPDDSGTSIGAALYLHAKLTGLRPKAPSNNNWGTEYSDQECLDTVSKFKLPNVLVVEDPSERAAQDLVEGKLIGWFQGRSEFGQRALGNRSIVADPRSAQTRELVNAVVKFREAFRPFAPAILAERISDYFECDPSTRVPYMEKIMTFRPDKRDLVPAVVHADGTGRVQTVGEEGPLRFRRLIEGFERRSGIPLVLNTSFNLNGEPIVERPEDAIRTFYACGLDVLYLGNVRISK